MKILIWESSSILSGGQKVALDILNALKNHYTCVFLTSEKGPLTTELRNLGIEYKIVPLGRYSIGRKTFSDILKLLYHFPKVFTKVYKYIKKKKIDLIYSNGPESFVWSPIIGTVFSIPVIWHIHSIFRDKKVIFLLNLLCRSKSIKKIIFASYASKIQFPNASGKAKVIYNGINIKKFVNKSDSSTIRRDFSIPETRKIVSTIGWIMYPKGQEILIKAIPRILEEYQNVHFVIIGGVREGQQSYYNLLRKHVDKLGIRNHITFTGHRDDVPSLLNDIYINTINSFESCPLVILEACAAGVPTVGANIGGTCEFIKNYQTGLIYKFGDECDLARKILILLKEENLYYRMRKNCKAYANKFRIEHFNRQIKTVVDQVLGSNVFDHRVCKDL